MSPQQFEWKMVQDNTAAYSKSLTGDNLRKIVMAGAMIILAYARINVNTKFSSKSSGGAGLQESIIIVEEDSSEHDAWVSIGPTKIYGRIHELGGTIKPIYAKMLSWMGDNGIRRFAKKVVIPARPYLRPAVDEHKDEIIMAMQSQYVTTTII